MGRDEYFPGPIVCKLWGAPEAALAMAAGVLSKHVPSVKQLHERRRAERGAQRGAAAPAPAPGPRVARAEQRDALENERRAEQKTERSESRHCRHKPLVHVRRARQRSVGGGFH